MTSFLCETRNRDLPWGETMRKRIVTETLLDECPNCGAAREGDEDVCRFCGTLMVTRQRVTEEVEEPEKTEQEQVAEKYASRRADVISDVVPLRLDGGFWGGVAFAVLWSLITLGGTFGILLGGDGLSGGFSIIPFAFFVFGVVLVISEMKPYFAYRSVKNYGTAYNATVIGYGTAKETVENGKAVTKSSMKVLAKVKGRELCIQLALPENISESTFPVGSRVRILGYDGNYVIDENV